MKALFNKIFSWYYYRLRGIKVWPGAYIYPTAKIGSRVSIGRNAEIGNNVIIGPNTRVGYGVFIPEGVSIGTGCFIGPGVIFTNDNFPPSPKSKWRKTLVLNGAAIGAGCVIKPGVVIHTNATVGCGSVVTKNIPSGEVWAGNPAAQLRTSLSAKREVFKQEVVK
jgi:UDP-2-acetamido-3-amino-2,3-dideoxy-glucuronate N-acetyltransferase